MIGKVDCPGRCGGQCEVREVKNGWLQLFHKKENGKQCFQAFIKDHDSVAAWRAYLAGDGAKPATPAAVPDSGKAPDAKPKRSILDDII